MQQVAQPLIMANALSACRCNMVQCCIVVNENSVGTGQVDAQTTHFGGEQKEVEMRRLVELVHQRLPVLDRCLSVHSKVVDVVLALDKGLEDVKHLGALAKQ